LQPQSVTRVLAELEAHGHITRLLNPADKRQRVFSISDAGRHALRHDMRLRDQWLASVMQAELTPAERDAILHAAAILERLADTD